MIYWRFIFTNSATIYSSFQHNFTTDLNTSKFNKQKILDIIEPKKTKNYHTTCPDSKYTHNILNYYTIILEVTVSCNLLDVFLLAKNENNKRSIKPPCATHSKIGMNCRFIFQPRHFPDHGMVGWNWHQSYDHHLH